MKIKYLGFILFFIAVVFGCNNILENSSPYNDAVLIISFSDFSSRTLTPSIDMEPASYDISGVAIGGETFEVIGLTL